MGPAALDMTVAPFQCPLIISRIIQPISTVVIVVMIVFKCCVGHIRLTCCQPSTCDYFSVHCVFKSLPLLLILFVTKISHKLHTCLCFFYFVLFLGYSALANG